MIRDRFGDIYKTSIELRPCRNKDPHPVPFHLPDETLDLARLAIERITSVDRHDHPDTE